MKRLIITITLALMASTAQAANRQEAEQVLVQSELPPIEQHPLYEGAIQELMATGMDCEQAAAYIQVQLKIRSGG